MLNYCVKMYVEGTYHSDKNELNLITPLNVRQGFIGSTAFISIAAEGETFGDVEDLDIRVKLSGVESHESYVGFQHIGAEAAGAMLNVGALVTITDLTTVGKNPVLGTTNVYEFFHSDGSIQPTTDRKLIGANLEVVGNTSGEVFCRAIGPEYAKYYKARPKSV